MGCVVVVRNLGMFFSFHTAFLTWVYQGRVYEIYNRFRIEDSTGGFHRINLQPVCNKMVVIGLDVKAMFGFAVENGIVSTHERYKILCCATSDLYATMWPTIRNRHT